ncbi:MAG: leucine-rich repeat domain-containing protein [Verrucomicrobia bacterium]|nr:leucine-rich repeat domain-containing protein [Verrucomicrobiota bacterium]
MASPLNWDSLPNELIVNILERYVDPRFREIDSRINQLILSCVYPDILRALYSDLQNPTRDSASDRRIYALLSQPIENDAPVLEDSDGGGSELDEMSDYGNLTVQNCFEEMLQDPDLVISRIEAVFKELMYRSESISDPKLRLNCQETLKGLHCSMALQAMSHVENQSLITFVDVLSDKLGGAFKARVSNILNNSKNEPNKTELLAHQFRQLLQESQAELDQIQQLDLSRRRLSSLPPEIGMLRGLVILDLDHNKLTRLPHEIGDLRQLVKLTLSNNQINKVPDEIGRLGQLSQLYLDSNKLEKVPLGVLSLDQLQILNLSSNLIDELPENISEMKELKELQVANNRIPAFPNSIGDLSNLERIDARNNLIQGLPNSFDNLKGLKALNLLNNKSFKSPFFLSTLPSLTELKLDRSPSSIAPSRASSSVKCSLKANSYGR